MSKTLVITGAIAFVLIAGFFVFNKSFNNSSQNSKSLVKEIQVGEDVCSEFPKEWVSSTIGKTIVQVKPFSMKGTYSCNYFINETNFAGINVDDLSVETQKKAEIERGNTIKTDPRIAMDHFIVVKPDGLIDGISLVLNPNKFVTVDRFYGNVFDNEGVIAFTTKIAERIQNGENVATNQNSVTTTNQAESAVPLPQGEDVIRDFFNLINEGKISDAVNMMSQSAISDDSQKQAWGVQFNAFKKITVKKIENSSGGTYMVTLDVQMKPESANAQPMPYYGYGDGEFTRWITLVKENNLWKITGIATGP